MNKQAKSVPLSDEQRAALQAICRQRKVDAPRVEARPRISATGRWRGCADRLPYATFNQFTKAVLGFFRKTLPDKWEEFRSTVTDNFRVVSLKEYRII